MSNENHSNKICEKFKTNNNINPLTGRQIKVDGFLYNLLIKSCEKPDLCIEYKKNKKINPFTNRDITQDSKIKLFLDEFCKQQHLESQLIEGKERLSYESDEKCLKYPNFTLKEHQIKTIKNMKENNRLLLFHSVGSGKTATSIAIIRCLLDWELIEPRKRIFILTPTSLVQNYKKEMEKLGVNFGKKIEIESYGVFLNRYRGKTRSLKNSIYIIDEAHNFKTHIKTDREGKRAEELMKFTKSANKVILLSATPVQNNINDFANMYAILKNQENDLLENPAKFYSNFEKNWYKMDLKGVLSIYSNIDRGDYPKTNEYFIDFEMTDEYYKVYKKIEESEEDKFFGKNLKIFYNGIRRAINRVDENIPTPKIIWTVDKIRENTKTNKKTLVYSNWLESGIRLVQKELDKLKISWMEISGSISSKIRGDIVEKYNRGDFKVLFVTAAGSEGLDLKETRTIIIIEPHWNNERIKQIIGRGVRYKSHESLPLSERTVDIYRLILKKPKNKMAPKEMLSADDYMLETSEKKEKEISKLYKRMLDFNVLK